MSAVAVKDAYERYKSWCLKKNKAPCSYRQFRETVYPLLVTKAGIYVILGDGLIVS